MIQQTATEQLLTNIVRVADHEPPLFMDVTEVDAALQLQGSFTGGVGGIGGIKGNSAQVGSLSLGLQYQETPTIRYFPLTGAALVSQTSNPITADSISYLLSSDWSYAAVLTFAVDRIASGFEDYYPALNAITELDQFGALEIIPAKSSDLATLTAPASAKLKPPQSTVVPNGDDTLVLFLRPNHPTLDPLGEFSTPDMAAREIAHLWTRLLKIYRPTSLSAARTFNAATIDASSSTQIDKFLSRIPDRIELAMTPQVPVARARQTDLSAPALQTRSALGILKAATEGKYIEFVNLEKYNHIRHEPWNRTNSDRPPGSCYDLNYYTLLSSDENPSDNPTASNNPTGTISQYKKAVSDVDNFIKNTNYKCLNTYNRSMDAGSYDQAVHETALGVARRYLLIIQDSSPPKNPTYLSIQRDGKWFYIDKEDEVTQRNFTLLAQFVVMQALVSSSAPPLSPTISVGPK